MASKAERKRPVLTPGHVGSSRQYAGRPPSDGERYPSGRLRPIQFAPQQRDGRSGTLVARSSEACHVYVIGPAVGAQKIGFAADVPKRLAVLQTGCPQELVVHYTTPVGPLAAVVEREVHRSLAAHKVRGEWFWVTPTHAGSIIEQVKARVLADRNESVES